MLISHHSFRPAFSVRHFDGYVFIGLGDESEANGLVRLQLSLEELNELLNAVQAGLELLQSDHQELPF
jgi:hypothetical protein